MYVDTSTVITSSGASHTRHLLRESFREDGKVKHRTMANLSHCSGEEIEAIRLALRHKDDLRNLGSLSKDVSLRQGLSFGAVWVVYQIAERLGIANALGQDVNGKLALWQVLARVINQGSRLSAVRLAESHAACDILGLRTFNEDNLYSNLNWLENKQSGIEDKLYAKMGKEKLGNIFLYDVTSSYFEGTKNDLAEFGYNRDRKRGKKQIVIGLLCDELGIPLSIQVFPGNTSDPKTFADQINKVKERFGVTEVTFVGDRGMIKSNQAQDILGHKFHYITAITKPQIEKLIKQQVFQYSLFDQNLAEVICETGERYVLRRNPIRADEIVMNRKEKLAALLKLTEKHNEYLRLHLRASAEKALEKVIKRAKTLGIESWCLITINERCLLVSVNETVRNEIAQLDGCYAIKTDLSQDQATKEIVHDRYKDLALVEKAFRYSKTVHLEMRPIYLRRENRTRAHAFIVMLAYKIIQHLSDSWRHLDITVEEGIKKLASLCLIEITAKNTPAYS